MHPSGHTPQPGRLEWTISRPSAHVPANHFDLVSEAFVKAQEQDLGVQAALPNKMKIPRQRQRQRGTNMHMHTHPLQLTFCSQLKLAYAHIPCADAGATELEAESDDEDMPAKGTLRKLSSAFRSTVTSIKARCGLACSHCSCYPSSSLTACITEGCKVFVKPNGQAELKLQPKGFKRWVGGPTNIVITLLFSAVVPCLHPTQGMGLQRSRTLCMYHIMGPDSSCLPMCLPFWHTHLSASQVSGLQGAQG